VIIPATEMAVGNHPAVAGGILEILPATEATAVLDPAEAAALVVQAEAEVEVPEVEATIRPTVQRLPIIRPAFN
jgi:hypothetical protein